MRTHFTGDGIKIPLPNLIQLQLDSYNWLFKEGIQEILDEISPVDDFTGNNLRLEFASYGLEEPRITEKLAQEKNLTYKAPLKCKAILTNKQTGKRKESDVFLGDFPVMTDRGTFIINGVERVVVSQIVRSYGVLFTAEEFAGRKLFGAKLIPARGAWLEIETSNRDVITVKVDRKRKIPISTFFKALGMEDEETITKTFADCNDNAEHDYLKATIEKDPAKTRAESYVEVYKRIRPGDLATSEAAKTFLEALFFNPKRYDLGKVGRYKLNQRLHLEGKQSAADRVLRLEDLIQIVKEVIRLNNDPTAKQDDIDHLKNRRVRAVGELVQGRLRVGFLRMERIIRDRMSVLDPATVTPAQLVNSRPIAAVLQEFFASSQLSQFMNQTNPLAELEHKRTLSSTGPGGLSRERAGFEVRDVHSSHYGRICPIETAEGPNIGLVGYMATYARVNEFGFIETPYLKVTQRPNAAPVVTKELVYMDAMDEETHIIAPASTPLDAKGAILGDKVVVRKGGTPTLERVEKIEYIDVSPRQMVSITTALIPFVEHDEATRAQMGSNMQRQAVPLVKPDAPVVGTGMEAEAARDSGHVILAAASGTVSYVDANEIQLKDKDGQIHRHPVAKFVRSNQATSLNQKPIVTTGQKVSKGDVIADGASVDKGELALGQNVLVAFLSFWGSNFEDAIILSERLVRDDRFTSIHIEDYSVEVRETKLGPELVTRDIPNVGEEALSHLDETGVVRIGAEVGPGDILVGKISPKGETELSAEEKLLRAIFGEKAKDVKDTSLRLPHGERGKVVGIRIFSKDQGDELPSGVYQMIQVSIAQLRKISVGDKLAGRHGNKGVISMILPEEEMPYLPDGRPVDIVLNPLGVISRMNLGQILETHLGWAADKLNYTVATPVFEGVSFTKIQSELTRAELPPGGKIQLYDGRTGEPFDQKTTVGVIYIMKLIHLVDDKMHARSTGPYSMVTQQPLGGKAQFGGQRFGEMEVWALEAYGAAHTLQEMLTIKSDDVVGRSKAYESLIRGEEIQKPSVPASFFVLTRELQSLGLNIELLKEGSPEPIVLDEKKAVVLPAPTGPTVDLGEPEPEEELDRAVTELKEEVPPIVSEPVEALKE